MDVKIHESPFYITLSHKLKEIIKKNVFIAIPHLKVAVYLQTNRPI